MSIAVLNQVYDEVRRLGIAGSNLAPGDFRLQKLIAPLKKSGAKAPVFAKIAQSIQTVVDSTEKQSPLALLDLSTLVMAVLYTQGDTGLNGKAKALPTVDLGMPTTGTSARVLKPVIESLTSTGSGRMEIVRDAFQRGAFKDIRLVTPALAALADPYPELADYVADEVLPSFGRTIYPELRSVFDPKGKGADVRRLRLMHLLDPDATVDIVHDALENGSKEVKVAAIVCMNHSKESLPLLLEQAKSKNKEVRSAAFQAMAKFKDAKVVEALQNALAGKDVGIAVAPASENPSPKLLTFLHKEAAVRRDAILGTAIKTRGKGKLTKFRTLLGAFIGRSDKKSVDLLIDLFARRDEFAKAKDTSCDGGDFNRTVALLLVSSDAKPALKVLTDQYESLDHSMLSCAFAAATKSLPPKKVFQMFSPYILAAKPKRKKRNDPVEAKRDVVEWAIVQAINNTGSEYAYYRARRYHQQFMIEELEMSDFVKDVKLAPEWLDVAVKADNRELVLQLARPKHKPTIDYFSAEIDRMLKQRDVDWELGQTLATMNQIGHPKMVECFLKAVEHSLAKKKRHSYDYIYWLGRLVPDLPKQVIAPLEKMIPQMPDNVADEFVPYLAELKSRHS